MEMRTTRSVLACLSLTFVAGGLVGCGQERLTAVERLENAKSPVVTVTGAIDVGPAAGSETARQVFIRFYAPPDTTMLEERQLVWSGSYDLDFLHDQVCGWWVDVTIWDGRRSERKPVSVEPPEPCAGFLQGPDFWFP